MVDRKKRYFWLQLKEDFFDEDTMQFIEEQPNGKEYALIYLKMCLKSLKLDGYLNRMVGNTMIPYDIPTLAKLVNSNVDTVRVAMRLFEEIGLVKTFDSGEIYMNQIKEMVGSETEAAKQKRIERSKNEVATLSQSSRKNVAQSIEYRDKSIELDKDKNIMSGSKEQDNIPYKEIVDYLNEKTGKNFKVGTDATRRVIKARFAEKNTLADFKKVIDVKSAEWRNDVKMQRYLQPSTLFGTKFEGYLNQSVGIKNNSQDIRNMSSEDISKLSEREIAEKWMGKDWVR